jgi:hypothetical protein
MRAVACELVEDSVRQASDRAGEQEEPRRVAPARDRKQRRCGKRPEQRRQRDRVQRLILQVYASFFTIK